MLNQKDTKEIEEFQKTSALFASQLLGLSNKIQEKLKDTGLSDIEIEKAQEDAKNKSEILTSDILSLQNKLKNL